MAVVDIGFDFDANDLNVFNGDFVDISDASLQNGTLILVKSAVNIFDCSVGLGLEENYPHIQQSEADAYAREAERQIKEDGATYADVEVTRTETGVDIKVDCKYV